MLKRTVFFVSESTGITAETLGHSLISQFEKTVEFHAIYKPYINTTQRAQELIDRFDRLYETEGRIPIVFATMADPEIRVMLKRSNCLYIELFDTFIGPLSKELGVNPSGERGRSHGITNGDRYENRMSIINFAMTNDDGARLDKYDQADVILVGVSRSGKTPTCLYLAMHFGLRAANYPLTEEDFEQGRLPEVLLRHTHKLIALTIDPIRLNRIREERRPGSAYASLKRCQSEVRQALDYFSRHQLTVIDTTSHSIEEISSRIMNMIRST